MNRSGNPAILAQARRRASLDKRPHTLSALAALAALEHDRTRITFTAVALAAGVSTWLTYTPGVREYIEAAQRRASCWVSPRPRKPPSFGSASTNYTRR
ncbi:hypothetical protein [Streptomyces sp. NPDC014685]|uniref:hypothetical protein n=1 Tax=Streptomyces sp. NPDC014685 TaxID=3364881 RepID=UPI0036F9FE9C